MKRSVLAAALVTLFCACGGGGGASPEEACNGLAEVTCEKFFECLTEDQRAAAGLTTEAACVADYKAQFGCAELTEDNACEANETYNSDEADSCIDQLAGLSCDQVLDGIEDSETPACNRVCTVE
ncbi:MAG TPA: hypothetical protein VKZ63_14370, partial [Kofleriaceae bacterium]|nr:hypothetical protein [Kofleriaceae bacterium]